MPSLLDKRIVSAVSILLALAIVSSLLAARQPAKSNEQTPAAGELLQERLDVLREIVRLQRQAHEQGRTDFSAVLTAEADVLSARLELAETPAERVAILKDTVANARQFEELNRQLTRAEQGNALDQLRAKAFRLRAQADLARAQSGARQ